jgi:hypothetical protein
MGVQVMHDHRQPDQARRQPPHCARKIQRQANRCGNSSCAKPGRSRARLSAHDRKPHALQSIACIAAIDLYLRVTSVFKLHAHAKYCFIHESIE